MSKYDFENDLSLNSSTGMILNKIQNGSAVLEFGCATGRMTRYMKEELACQVYIVEYENEAYNTALEYATDGLCDDIMQFKWVEKFQNAAFDAIIFADTLRQQHPALSLSADSIHFNIIDQFIETNSAEYVTEIQIPILD